MRPVSCLLLVLAASCASSPKVPLRTQQELWLRSERASIESALRLEPKRARLRVADDAIDDLNLLLQELNNADPTLMVLIGEWYLVRASATADKADRKAAMDYFENVIVLGDAWPVVAAIVAAKDGLKRAQAKG